MKLTQYYEHYDEAHRLTNSRAHNIEYVSTIKALEPYIQSTWNIIELGAGSGAYIDYFSKRCESYVASDIVEKHVDDMKEKYGDISNVSIERIDAACVPKKYVSFFDLVLCFGPYYHTSDKNIRIGCIQECISICKDGGFIAIAYINKQFVNQLYLKCGIGFTAMEYECLVNSKNSEIGYKDNFLEISYFCTPEEIVRELSDCNLKIVDHLRTDGPYGILSDRLEALTDEEYEALVQYHLKTCREKSILGMSAHGLIIGKKET